MRAIAYSRVSTAGQAGTGLGLEDQRTKLDSEAKRRGWQIIHLTDAGSTAKNARRPALIQAREMLAKGEAQVLMVAKLDRLSRSLIDFVRMLEQGKAQGWDIVALDLAIDTSTPQGELMRNILMAFADYEGKIIRARTSDALQVAKRQGRRLGRPVLLSPKVRARIERDHQAGMSLRAIARQLNDEGVPTAQGGAMWHASTVSVVLRSLDLDAQAQQR
jgi:DNA invertase Pin-like site-specific DNA recombinase